MGATMRVLALETSGKLGSLAILSGSEQGPPQLLEELQLPPDMRSAESLVPALSRLLSQHAWQAQEIDLICVATGPGSFTGLRIGVTTAKTYAYASGSKVVGAHTLAVLAAGTPSPEGRLWTILDAQRRELFVAEFSTPDQWTKPGEPWLPSTLTPETHIQKTDDWLRRLQPGDAVLGPPLEKMADRLPAGVIQMPRATWQPSAAAVGRLGIARFSQSGSDDPMQLVPYYYRKSAAEEQQEKNKLPPSNTR